MARSKLAPQDWKYVSDQSNLGKTSDEIAASLLKERGITLHGSNIRRWLVKNKTSVEAQEAADQTLDDKARAFLREFGTLPAVPQHIRTTRIEEMGFDTPQPHIALFSDLHYGSKIDRRATGGLAEYNIDICRERLTTWRNTILRFHQQDSLAIEIPALNLFALGDDIEGHGDMFPTQKLQMDDSVLFQQLGFVEDMTSIILSFLERYPKVNIYKVYGNHGRIAAQSKGSYGPDNLELMAWNHIADRVAAVAGGEWSTGKTGTRHLTGGSVDFHITPAFFILANIENHLIYARHGHMIGGLTRTYTGAVDNKFRMNAILRRQSNYMFKAHLHEAQEAEPEIGGQVIQNGCFVGPSLLSVEMNRAAASLPSQEMYSLHPKNGLTNHHRIRMARPEDFQKYEVVGEEDAEVIRV